MTMSPELRTKRARLAANSRHHPGEPERAAADAADLELARDVRRFGSAVDEIDAVGEIVARAGKMTAEQAGKIGRLFTYLDAGEG
jgi:hypothetical protein